MRAVQLRLHAERGDRASSASDADELAAAVRDTAYPAIALAFAAAAQLLLAQRQAEQAQALLHELDQLTATAATPVASGLPSLLRVVLALDDAALAERLIDPRRARHATPRAMLTSARAQLAEAADDHVDAARLYEEAAERWREFGSVPERAYALLGQGRCLAALGRPEAQEPLRVARELFASMGTSPRSRKRRRCSARARPPPCRSPAIQCATTAG